MSWKLPGHTGTHAERKEAGRRRATKPERRQRADCCCHRGAARGDEYPEAPCRMCPVHFDPESDHTCRRHTIKE